MHQLADVSSSLRSLTGHSSLLDHAISITAQDLMYAMALVLVALLLVKGGVRAGLAAIGGAVIALLIAHVIGGAWTETRPFVAGGFTPLFPHAADASFPSDHLCALGAVTAAVLLASRWLGAVAFVISALVAVARVAAGVHYVQDVVGGFLIGAACGLLLWWLLALADPLIRALDTLLHRLRLRPESATG